MASNEIKKALECCTDKGCLGCPYYCANTTCIDKMFKDILAYINELETEVEKFTTAHPKTLESIRKIYTTAKSEAIKEFAERLNAKAQNANTWTGIEPVVTISDIEDTAKEMVGDEVV